jgi:hypothetical protein
VPASALHHWATKTRRSSILHLRSCCHGINHIDRQRGATRSRSVQHILTARRIIANSNGSRLRTQPRLVRSQSSINPLRTIRIAVLRQLHQAGHALLRRLGAVKHHRKRGTTIYRHDLLCSQFTRNSAHCARPVGCQAREGATGVRRETVSGYLKAAVVAVRGRGGRPTQWPPPNPATTSEVSTDSVDTPVPTDFNGLGRGGAVRLLPARFQASKRFVR